MDRGEDGDGDRIGLDCCCRWRWGLSWVVRAGWVDFHQPGNSCGSHPERIFGVARNAFKGDTVHCTSLFSLSSIERCYSSRPLTTASHQIPPIPPLSTSSQPAPQAASIALLTLAPLCRLVNLACSFTTVCGLFCTTSSPSVKISSMWHGLLMYGLMRPWAR